jgi:hypothetical protein
MTMRERMAAHRQVPPRRATTRSIPSASVLTHGRFRNDRGMAPVDSAGERRMGTKFSGPTSSLRS